MKFLKAIKKTLLFIALAYIGMGVLMILGEADYKNYFFIVLAAGLGVAGILEVVRYFLIPIQDRIKRNDFIIGLLLVAVGVLFYFFRESLSITINNISAILIVILGLVLVQDLLDVHACGKKQNAFYSFVIILAIGLGVLTYLNPFADPNVSYTIMGASMIYIGVVNIISNINVAICISSYEKLLEEVAKEKADTLNEIEQPEDALEIKENVIDNNDDTMLNE